MERRGSLYGRRKGKPLSARRTALMATAFRALSVDPTSPRPTDPASLFPEPVDGVRLEIGFGGGEHLLHEARNNPGIAFFGVEPFQEGMAKAVAAISDEDLRNIRLNDGDAALLLDWLPDASLERVDLLFPDPWPKRRHWKRRFVNQPNLDRIARVLVPGGSFRFASDIASYVDWTLLAVSRCPELIWLAEKADDWRRPYDGWPGTRYEAKALAAGRTPAYLTFARRDY